MDALNRPIVPPAPKVHANDLSSLHFLFEFTRNTLAVWPEHAFDDLISINRALGVTSALVNDPDGVRHILTTGAEHYIRPVPFYRITRPLAGSGVLLAEGDDWKRQRRMLAPMFNPGSVALFLPHFIEAADTMAGRLETTTAANLSAVFHDTALDAVLKALFSVSANAAPGLADMARRYIAGPGRPKALDGFAASEGAFKFDTGGRRRFQKAWFAAVDALIATRKSQPVGDHKDLLDLLLAAHDPETGEALPDAEVRAQCATMLFAGFETTSRLLFWASYLLTLDPVEQGRLRREALAFPPERVSGLGDLQHWPRLRNTLLETLRLYPSVPQLVRKAISDDVVLDQPIQAGVQVWISPWVMHRHRKFWDQPNAFVPDRFTGQVSPWTNGAFIPFGGGPRICIGASFALAEAQIVMATLLSRFEFSLDDACPVIPVANVTIAPNFEPRFRLEPV